MSYINLIGGILIALGLGFYLILALQWFNYKLRRLIFHYKKPLWHLYFFILPLIFYAIFSQISAYLVLAIGILQILCLYLWHRKLDKKLVFTSRIKRFFVFLILYCILCICFEIVIIPLILALVTSYIVEKLIAFRFKKVALKKLNSIPNLKIILITASFGKTSMKNFLFEILQNKFTTYKTPRSVNTLSGIIKDINENLQTNTEIYIAEAGARQNGDIKEITEFLQPQFVIVGEIGKAHIEYFKSIENIRKTKLEALSSNRLKKAFLHSTTKQKDSDIFTIYDDKVSHITSNLDGIKFNILLDNKKVKFSSNILGGFNSYNICVAVLLALNLGIEIEKLVYIVSKIKSVSHRLEKIKANGKLIIDDSFNGNLNGMKGSYEIIKSFSGRKIILTPGIIEGSKEDNLELSKAINETFDLVIITSSLNEKELQECLTKPKVVILKDKSKMQDFLAQNTAIGDLILFSNDAPSFM